MRTVLPRPAMLPVRSVLPGHVRESGYLPPVRAPPVHAVRDLAGGSPGGRQCSRPVLPVLLVPSCRLLAGSRVSELFWSAQL
ncbi:hypothetical protein GCM10009630_45560 [Kribbella jejuensis]